MIEPADPDQAATRDAKSYYESETRAALEAAQDAQLHLGLFERADDDLRTAKLRATEAVGAGLEIDASSLALDAGCGTGAGARHLVERYGCRVIGANIALQQVRRGRELNHAAGIERRIDFVLADYHHLPLADASVDLWWCQEALLHASDRRQVLADARRVLRPGGMLAISDLVVPADTPEAVHDRIRRRISAPPLWDPADYDRTLAEFGFEVLRRADWSEHVAPTYTAMRAQTLAKREQLAGTVSEADFNWTVNELQVWVDQAKAGRIGWFHYLARG